MNPFIHVDSYQAERDKRDNEVLFRKILYIEGELAFMYKLDPDFTKNLIAWYKKYSLTKLRAIVETAEDDLKDEYNNDFKRYCGYSFGF